MSSPAPSDDTLDSEYSLPFCELYLGMDLEHLKLFLPTLLKSSIFLTTTCLSALFSRPERGATHVTSKFINITCVLFSYQCIYPFISSFIHYFILSFIRLFLLSLFHSPNNRSLIDPSIHPFIHLLVRSFMN